MPNPYRSVRRHRSWAHVLTATMLFVVQLAIAASPFWEARGEGRLGIHTEREGARHAGMHNEAACLVCSVRSLHAAPSTSANGVVAMLPVRMLVVTPAAQGPTRSVRGTNLSRAPPFSG
jgi:hypothetical protein